MNESISVNGSSGSSEGSNGMVLMPISLFNSLNSPGTMASNDSALPPSLFFEISVSNSGLNFHMSADNERIYSMLFCLNISSVQVTNFLSSAIMHVLTTFGPWAHGYGLYNERTQVHFSVTAENPNDMLVSSSITHTDRNGATNTIALPWINQTVTPHSGRHSSVVITDLDDAQEVANAIGQVCEFSEDENLALNDIVIPPAEISEMVAVVNALEIQGQEENLLTASASDVNTGTFVNRKGKAKAPICVSAVRRSNRSNKYDGFKIPSMTDSKVKNSKVKPRVTPKAPSGLLPLKVMMQVWKKLFPHLQRPLL